MVKLTSYVFILPGTPNAKNYFFVYIYQVLFNAKTYF